MWIRTIQFDKNRSEMRFHCKSINVAKHLAAYFESTLPFPPRVVHDQVTVDHCHNTEDYGCVLSRAAEWMEEQHNELET